MSLIHLPFGSYTNLRNKAYGGCTCSCHRDNDVIHCFPCCYPEDDKPLTFPDYPIKPNKDSEFD